MAQSTINDLKRQLGVGLGLRKNKYMLEIPMPAIPGIDSEKINILARNASLPERNITTAQIFHKGRQYNVRGETDYGSTYEITVVDDSSMSIRKIFDKWLRLIDDTKLENGIFSGGSYEIGVKELLDAIKSGVNIANKAKAAVKNPSGVIGGFFLGAIDRNQAYPSSFYQTDINVWQLSSTGDKVYGYKLQNAFPTQIGSVTLDDSEQDTLTEFTIQFTFSEFIPLEGISVPNQVLDALLGGDVQDIIHGVETFVR